MATARSEIYDREVQGVYHCYNNVVQGLRLLRERQIWLEERLADLASIFAVDVLTFAILETNYRSILRNRPDVAKTWDDRKVVTNWLRLNAQSLELNPIPDESDVELILEDKALVQELRLRLADISWFMKMLNEPIARAVNSAIENKGHVWRERFQMQVITDDEALLACALSVDLFPLKEPSVTKLEEAKYSGIWLRIQSFAKTAREKLGEIAADEWPEKLSRAGWLLPISADGDGEKETGRRCSDRGFWKFSAKSYLELVYRLGRYRCSGQKASKEFELPKLFEHLRSRIAEWLDAVDDFVQRLGRVVGKSDSILDFSKQRGKNFTSRLRRNGNAFG